MKRIKKTDSLANDSRVAGTASKAASLSARDPLAYAAALRALG